MSLLDDAKAAIPNYGINGDDSFECLGVDLNTAGISDVKTYRYYRSRNNAIVDWSKELGHPLCELIDRFEKSKIIRFREMSKAKTSAGNRYKLYFSVKCNIPFEQHFQETASFLKEFGYSTGHPIRNIEKCISSYLSPGRSPLLMLGVEMNNHLVKSLKAHMTLERFSDYSQRIGEKLFFDELEDTITDISKFIRLSQRHLNQYTKIGQVSSHYLFYPFLIGINQYDERIEYKLYFRIKYNGLTNEQIYDFISQMVRSLDEFVNVDQLVKTVRELFEIGLFMEGFALESKVGFPLTVKAYFFPLPMVKL